MRFRRDVYKRQTQREAARLQEYLDHLLLTVPFLSSPYPFLYAMGGSARAVKTLAAAIGLWKEETSGQLPLSLLDSLQSRLFCSDGEALLSRFLPERIRTFPIGLMVLRAIARQADVDVYKRQMKALGYGPLSILSYYLIYALLATLLGCVLGFSIGFWLFPFIISNAYGIMYSIPPVPFVYWPDTILLCALIAVACTTIPVMFAVLGGLRELSLIHI